MLGPRLARFNRNVTNKLGLRLAYRVPSMACVVHHGRRTEKTYLTPVHVFRTDDGLRIAMSFGSESDWVKNVLASGHIDLVSRRRWFVGVPKVVTDPKRRFIPAPARWWLRLTGVNEFIDIDTPIYIGGSNV